MESGLTRINDIDGEVLIITKPTFITNSHKVNFENSARSPNKEKQYDTKNSTTEDEIFNCLDEFTSVMCSVVGNTNYELLEYLLTIYRKNISRIFCSCCFLKPFKFVKLKNHIKDTLIFFHFCWRNVKERVSDDYTYMDKMTEIVRMYLDLEVLSSSKDSDSFDNLSANILHALHIYLDNCEEHVFKVLLKSKCVTKTFSRIYSPIFQKYFSNLKSNAESISNLAYVRYLLAFILWKKIASNREEKAKITDMALIKLGSSMPKMDPELSQFIPEPPTGDQNGTLWLMQANLFDFRKACDCFLMLEAKMHSFSFSTEFEDINLNQSNAPFLQLDIEDGFKRKADSKLVKIRKKKPISRKVFPKLKPGEVLSIDLTSDKEQVEEININKRKIKKKQQWLKEAKVHRKFKKPQPFPKQTKVVQVADAHSTESCESLEKTRSENSSFFKTVYNLDKYSVCRLVEENIVSSQSAENKANALRNQNTSAVASLTNMCQSCNITSNAATQKSNTNKINMDSVHSSTTYVTSVCDKLRTSVLHNESRDIFNYITEDISSQSGKMLPTIWDNRSDRTEVCAVSTTVGDHASESSSGAWTDYNSADSEAPDTIASPTSEIFINPCKIQLEELIEEPELGGFSTTVSDPLTPEKTIDVCLSETVARTSPTKLDNIWSGEMNTMGFHKFSEDVASYLDHHIPSDSLLEGSLGPTGILNSLLDFDLIGHVDSSPTDFVYSNVQAIDPKLLRKDPDEFDFKISNLFSEDSPLSFENEEKMEMTGEHERVDDRPKMLESEVKVSEELAEMVEKPVKRGDQIKDEVSSTSRKISETQGYNTRHKRNSVAWENLMEVKAPKRRKRSKRSSSLSSDTEDLFRRERGVQLPFKKRCCHTYHRKVTEKKNLGIIKKGV